MGVKGAKEEDICNSVNNKKKKRNRVQFSFRHAKFVVCGLIYRQLDILTWMELKKRKWVEAMDLAVTNVLIVVKDTCMSSA